MKTGQNLYLTLFTFLFLTIGINMNGQNTFKINYDIEGQDQNIFGRVVGPAGGNTAFLGMSFGANYSLFPFGSVTNTDPSGNVLWSKGYSDGILGIGFPTIMTSLDVSPAGNFVMSGITFDDNMLMIETNNAGDLNWGKKYNYPGSISGELSAVSALSGGGYIAAGSIKHTGTVARDSSNIYLMKISATGALTWGNFIVVTEAFENDHVVNGVAEVTGGYVFIGSTSQSGAIDEMDPMILKTDASGTVNWTKKVTNVDTLLTVSPLSTGEVLVSAMKGNEFVLMRINAAGTETWSNIFSTTDLLGLDILQISGAFETLDGNYATYGFYTETLSLTPFNYLVKVDPTTDGILFEKSYELDPAGLIAGLFSKATRTTDGGYSILTGGISTGGGFDYQLIKTDANGTLSNIACPSTTIALENTAYTPSFAAMAPASYPGGVASNFTPVVTDITPNTPVACCKASNVVTASAGGVSVCAGQTITITASGSDAGVTYNIYNAASGGTVVGTAGTPFVPTQSSYWVEAESPIGCLSDNRIEVNNFTIQSAPTATISGGGAACAGLPAPDVTITLTGTANWSVTYDVDGTPTTVNPITASPYTISGGAAGTYTITNVTDAACVGTFSGSAVITSYSLPTVVANTTDATPCDGEQITLTGGGATSYTWDNGVTDGLAFTPSSLTYVVTGTDGNGCENTDQVVIAIDALPSVVASSVPGISVCPGDQITLTGSGATSYTWDNGVTDGLAFTPSSLTYTVTGTDVNGCENTDQIAITVNSIPTVVANASDLSPCDGDQITLFGSGADTYAWDNLVIDNALFVPSAITYTVTGTDVIGCTNTDQITIAIDALPDAVANSDVGTTVCDGSTIILTGSSSQDPNVTYAWNPITVTDGLGFIPPAAATTTYEVQATNTLTGCISSTSGSIDILSTAPPVAGINGTTNGTLTPCSNETTTLIATPAGAVYLWTLGGEITDTIEVMPTVPTTYEVTVTIGSCSDVTDITINPFTAPTGGIIGSTGTTSMCLGTTEILTANPLPAGAYTYEWSPTETSVDLTITPLVDSVYSVVIIDANLCRDTLDYAVTVNSLPVVSISGVDTLCIGESTLLTATSSPLGSSFIWTNPVDVGASVTVTPTAGTTTFSVEGTDGNGCIGTAFYDVYVSQLPSVVITGNSSVCLGGSVILTAVSAVPGGTYNWTNSGETTPSITVSPVVQTIYTVEDQIGTCIATAQFTVDIISSPNIVIGADTSIIIGQNFTLNAINTVNPTITTQYSWISPNDNLDCLNCSSPIASPEETIEYCVVGEQNGCLDTTCINVEVVIDCGDVFVPNAFSPNGDNNNECLMVYSNCLETMILRIYARWGEVVFETTDIDGCWDGTYKGQALNTATFAYVLEYTLIDNSSAILKGNVSLIK